MPCTTPGCPAELASAPRRYHEPPCRYAASRSGPSGAQGGERVTCSPEHAELIREARARGLESALVEGAKKILGR